MKHLAVALTSLCLFTLPVRADLLLAGFSGDAIYKYDGTSATLFAADPDPGGPNAMNGPTAMVFDSSGDLLVLNEFAGNVLKFSGTSGAFLGNVIPKTLLVDTVGVADPGDMELGADGNLYIMGHGAPGLTNIYKFSTSGSYVGPFSTVASDRHQHGLVLGPGGDWYQGVVDGRSIQRYSGSSGAFVSTFATGPTSGPSDMWPMGDLDFGPGSMYVTVDGTKGVARFTTTPTTGTFAGYLSGTSGSAYWGLLVDGGTLYVSNLSGGSIQKFDAATGLPIGSPVSIGDGAFDIIAMPAPEPAGALLMALCALRMWGRRRS